jgi:hypothetical protein
MTLLCYGDAITTTYTSSRDMSKECKGASDYMGGVVFKCEDPGGANCVHRYSFKTFNNIPLCFAKPPPLRETIRK